MISAPWWGKRNDRHGYTKNLYVATAIVAVMYAGHMIVQNLVQLALLRAMLGFARGGMLPALYSLTSLYTPQERRGGMIAIASSMTILGNMLGPVIGGYVAGVFGFNASFAANSCLLLGMSLMIWKFLPEPPRGESQSQELSPRLETSG